MKDALLSNGGWLLRVLTMIALVAVVALSLFPRFVSHISASAIVNAPLLVIRSPVEGLVEEYVLQNGIPIAEGQSIAVFREAGTDLTQRADLEARLAVSVAAAKAVEARIEDVEIILRNLLERQKSYAAWHTAILEQEVEELEARRRGASARLAILKAEADRAATLRNRGMISESQQTDVSGQAEIQHELMRELSARLAVRRLKLEAMTANAVLAGTDGTNTPYTLQRQDEVGLELARLRDELIDHRAERDALERQLAQEIEIYRRENRITMVSPISGVVWRSASLSGRPVLPGDEVVEILDCGARFLEAYLPERLMGSIAVGDLADVRLTGEGQSFAAPIVSILGHGARFDHIEMAAQDNAPKAGKMRIVLELSADRLGLDPWMFCHVGRTAQVSLPRDLSVLSALADRLRFSVQTAMGWVGSVTAQSQRG